MLRQTKFRRGFLIFRLPQTYGDSEMEKMQKLIYDTYRARKT